MLCSRLCFNFMYIAVLIALNAVFLLPSCVMSGDFFHMILHAIAMTMVIVSAASTSSMFNHVKNPTCLEHPTRSSRVTYDLMSDKTVTDIILQTFKTDSTKTFLKDK